MCVAELVIGTIAGAAIALALLEEAGVLDLHHIERAFWVVSPGMVPSVPFVLYFHADDPCAPSSGMDCFFCLRRGNHCMYYCRLMQARAGYLAGYYLVGEG